MSLTLRTGLVATARRMHELGLAPGTSGNVSVRTATGFLVTPTGIAYDDLAPDDVVEHRADGSGGSPAILDAEEVDRVGAKLCEYGQPRGRPKQSWSPCEIF